MKTLTTSTLAILAIAAWMERIAPTRIWVGPGERQSDKEIPAETAIVISGFAESFEGRVSVRGETWAAATTPEEGAKLAVGMAVRIVDRVGLRLVVTSSPR